MARRTLVSVSAFAALTAALALVATVPAAGQAPSAAKTNGAGAKAYTPAKTPDGQPDLSGYWTNATLRRWSGRRASRRSSTRSRNWKR